MANPKNEKRKQYAHYAAHCMYLVTAATDPDARAIQREMAAEWLKLADAILHPMVPAESPSRPPQVSAVLIPSPLP
jgi:hypothetical protein